MFPNTLPKNGRQFLALLGKNGITKRFYLAGGTAVALQLNHRESYDLDFFTQKNIDPLSISRDIKGLGKFEVFYTEKNTLAGTLDGVKISFITYSYPLLFPTIVFEGINLADLRDIALMKLTAISSRGSKKDFFDLYEIIQHQDISLKDLFCLFDKKFSGINYEKVLILKSLTYFEDADKEAMPKLIKEYQWKDVKKFFIDEVKKTLEII